MGLGGVGDDPGQGGLAAAGRAPEDQRAEAVGLDQAAQKLALPKDVVLTYVFRDGARPHALGQRGDFGALGCKKIHRQGLSIPGRMSTGVMPQISRAYSWMVRSLENFPMPAVFRTARLAHSSLSWNRALTSSWQAM